MSLKFFADYSGAVAEQDLSHIVTVPVLVALLVCLIPTTIGGLLSAIGIAGMDRLIAAISSRRAEGRSKRRETSTCFFLIRPARSR